MIAEIEFAPIDVADKKCIIEYEWTDRQRKSRPLVVFLHEGLGSRAMWKDFPARLCSVTGTRGLVYSRPGYGQSTQRAKEEYWRVDFMHRQAYEVLPALLSRLAIENPLILFGHSDGASIALLYASKYPDRASAVIVMAPHLFVEDISTRSIRQARQSYLETDLPKKLGRYHKDPDSAFWGWNDIWLNPDFREWNIEEETERVRAPILAMQGVDDEYGTLEQVRRIGRLCERARVVEIPRCGHSPHRDQPDIVIAESKSFLHESGLLSSYPLARNNSGTELNRI